MAQAACKQNDQQLLSDEDVGAFAAKFGVSESLVRELIKAHGRDRETLEHEAKVLWMRGAT